MIWDKKESSKPLSTVLCTISNENLPNGIKTWSHLQHIFPLEGQEKMCNPFHPSFYSYLFITLNQSIQMGVITISTHRYLPEIISFSIGKIVQDEA